MMNAASNHNIPGVSLSRATLHGKISENCVEYALAGSLYNIVNHLFSGNTDDVL